jgi:O-antigen/teichoic acid export membrane protein
MKLLRQNLLLNVGVALAVALPLMLCAPVILRVYGPGFREGTAIFVLTMIAGVFIAMNNLFSRAMQSAGKAWIELASNGLYALVVMLASWPLIHLYKGLGNVAAYTLAAIALLLWQWLIVRRILRQGSTEPIQPAG